MEKFISKVWDEISSDYELVLEQRKKDRCFLDQRVKACAALGHDVFGQRDANGRVVVGPIDPNKNFKVPTDGANMVAPLPDYLKGEHVTLFGLSDTINHCNDAMNAFSLKLKEEPKLVQELLNENKLIVPKWGVDAEDSITPLQSIISSCNKNLQACLDGTIQIHTSRPSVPFKRIPGLAIPWKMNRKSIPMHIVDLVSHLYKNWNKPSTLVFYVPKLENEEEAAYMKKVILTAEKEIQLVHPKYQIGTIRILVVIENARAIFRVNEIMDELYPYFAGASLGWHDYLASTARIFKNDPNYRIPVKADPNIVIKHVKASHELLANVVGKRGGIAIGGMYGVLPVESDPRSLYVSLAGFIKDVTTQLHRGLVGFWIARPDFVRTGLALVQAYKTNRIVELTNALLDNDNILKQQVLEYLDHLYKQPKYNPNNISMHQLVVSNIPESKEISNNHPEEIRYNVKQSLKYIGEWLAGNACVSLPGKIQNTDVTILDDLATVERSRWELWAEIRYQRFSVETFIQIVHQELRMMRLQANSNYHTKWHPIAARVLIKFVTDLKPLDFVTELLLPLLSLDQHDDHKKVERLIPLETYVERFDYFFERCGSIQFATNMATTTMTDLDEIKKLILNFDMNQIIQAASFHGDIGQNRNTLDKMADSEQAKVAQEETKTLREYGQKYLDKFGIKFLVSAKGKTGMELLDILKSRINNTLEQELENAKFALWEITAKRIHAQPLDILKLRLEELLAFHNISGASICTSGKLDSNSFNQKRWQTTCIGQANKIANISTTKDTLFEIASLSKTIGSAFAIEYFNAKNISLDTPANEILKQVDASFRIQHPQWADKVLLKHLMSHSALNMHYVNGVPLDAEPEMLDISCFLNGNEKYGYPKIEVINEPGTTFKYSGGGFLVLEYIIQQMEGGKSIVEITKSFLRETLLGERLTFNPKPTNEKVAHGYDDTGQLIQGTRKMFPAFAAGALGTPQAMLAFLSVLGDAYQNVHQTKPISHDTAVQMLFGTDKGCQDFMGCLMGLGVFIGEAGLNRFMIHQGANDGFRAIYIYCFDGPDQGAGIVIFANGDNRAMMFIAQATQEILKSLKIEGVDVSKFQNESIEFSQIPQEEIVNIGYKNMVFNAFTPTLPDAIIEKGPKDPLAPFNRLVNASVLKVSNQRFARVENLFSTHLPIFDPELFCPMGKVMDSWETARHNMAGMDFAVFQLEKPSSIQFVAFSTKYHYGNQAEYVQLTVRIQKSQQWVQIIPKTHLEGHADIRFELDQPTEMIDQIIVEIFPDGGLSRIALYDHQLPRSEQSKFLPISQATCIKSSDPIPTSKKPLQLLYEPSQQVIQENLKNLVPGQEFDVASLAYGASLVSVTNQHYGPAGQVFSPYMPLSMHDGFESARSREPNHHEELIVALAVPSTIHAIQLDFTFFVNNNPRHVSILGRKTNTNTWIPLVENSFVKPYAGNQIYYRLETTNNSPKVDQLQLLVYPDGGVNRFKAFTIASNKSNL